MLKLIVEGVVTVNNKSGVFKDKTKLPGSNAHKYTIQTILVYREQL